MDMILELTKLFIIAFVLTDLGEFISELIPTPKKKWISIPVLIIRYWMSCPKCFTFWLILIMTGNLFWAALLALIINYTKQIEYKIKSKTEL